MTDFYCDHGAYGLATNRLGLDVPVTWGVPQEGDGSSKDPSTTSSIAEIRIIASPTASETIVIAGATITAGASAAANVFVRGATPAATATNIVTLLNSSNATATLNSLAAIGTPQLRNAVYARVKPGNNDTVQIMFRIGSDTLDHAVNSNVAITSNGWASTPTITQFAGGSGGCWGWFLNPSALGQGSSIAAVTYGCFLFTPYVCSQTLPTIFDQVYVRTGGGESKVINYTSSSSVTMNKSSAWNPRLILDTNTKWTSDSAIGTLHLNLTGTGYSSTWLIRWTYSTGIRYGVRALRRGGFKISWNTIQSSITFICIRNTDNSSVEFYGVEFEDNSTNSDVVVEARWLNGDSAALSTISYINCKFSRTVAKPTISQPFSNNLLGYSSTGDYLFAGCEFNFNVSGAGDPGALLGNASYWANGTTRLRIRNCRFVGREGGFTLYAGSYPSPTNNIIVAIDIDNCTGIAMPQSYWGMPTATHLSGSVDLHTLNILMPNGEFRYETQRGVSEWIQGVSPAFPTLSANTLDGTPWSIRHLWVNGSPTPARADNFPVLHLTNRLTDAVRTITVQTLIPDDVIIAYGSFECTIEYIDEDSIPRGEMVGMLQSSSASWVGVSNWPNHVAKKFELTTEYAVKQNTDVTVTLALRADPGTGTNEYVFIDPEIGII